MKICLFVILFHIRHITGSPDHCIHGGNRYKNGDFFPPNGTIIKTENSQQCVQCRCQQGFVVCEIEKCKLLTCETPVQEPEYCCPRCPESAVEASSEPSHVAVQEPEVSRTGSGVGKNKRNGCTSNGKSYKDGSVWQPVMGPLGVMSCVQCRCEKGVILCKRFQCKNLPCSNPKKVFGKCCPVCPDAPSSDMKIRTKCFPTSSELFVFKSQDVGKNSTKIEYAFLDGKAKDGAMYLNVSGSENEGDNLLTMKMISYKEFLDRDLKLLGATSHRRFKKYSRKAQELKGKCPALCVKNIFRLERSLKIYAANVRSKCNEDEMDVNKFLGLSPES